MRRTGAGVWVAIGAAVLVAVAVVAFVVVSSRGGSGTPRQQMVAWVADTGLGQDLGALRDDGRNVQKVVAGRKGTVAIHTVCDVLSLTAEAAHANLPSPDTRVTQLLSRAYTLDYDAGNNCYDAGAGNGRLLRKSAQELARAQHIVDQVLGRISSITGATVPTTTTTVPTTGATDLFG